MIRRLEQGITYRLHFRNRGFIFLIKIGIPHRGVAKADTLAYQHMKAWLIQLRALEEFIKLTEEINEQDHYNNITRQLIGLVNDKPLQDHAKFNFAFSTFAKVFQSV